MNSRTRHSRWLVRAEWVVAVSACLWAVVVHVVVFLNAGPLWRDEVNSYNLAAIGTLADAWGRMEFDSFPVLPFVLLRGWTLLFGDSDATLRAFGFAVGLAVLAALWLAARTVGMAAPLLSTALVGFSGAAVRYGDSLRGYGLGMLLAVLTIAAVRAMLRGRYLLPALLIIVAVHATFYNALVVFAACAGAVAVELRRGRVRAAAKVVGIGALAAATLLPYVPLIGMRGRWEAFAQYAVDPLWMWKKFSDALALSGAAGVQLWMGLLFAAAAAGTIVATRGEIAADERGDTATYLLVTLVMLTVAYAVFLFRLQYLLQPWYFVVYLAAAALCVDGLIAPFERLRYGTAAIALLAIAVAAAAFPAARRAASLRFTSMDRAAATIASHAAPGDFVVVYPWYCGVSFARSARDGAWVTLPPMPDHRVQRYDLALQVSADPFRSAAPVIARVEQTLARGHTVWLAGFPLFEESAAYLRNPERARGGAAADLRWCALLASSLRAAGAHGRVVLPRDPSVSEYENAIVEAFR